MESRERVYIAIDLKSFYASVECRARNLDPMTTNLVVADKSRTEKTICLAVSPSLKSYGIGGRARLFEVVQKVAEVNGERKWNAPRGGFTGSSVDATELAANPALKVDYVVAPPRMAKYIEVSAQIYQVYLKYVAPEDIHVYSIDEVFMDVTAYLKTYGLTPHDLAMKMILDVLATTGITATAGIGTNMYLAKVAMDIVAKHIPADENGVRIAELDERSYRELLWSHKPLTDFWRVGRGTARKLEQRGIYTMGDIARCSLGEPGEYYTEELLYRLLGINAELLIDHAWGWEPVGMADVKSYRPSTNCVGSGQVLQEPYETPKARLVAREMAEMLALDLVEKGLVTDQIVLTVGYDVDNLTDPQRRALYTGDIVVDRFGRQLPKHAHGTANLGSHTSSTRKIADAVCAVFDRVVVPGLLVRRVNMSANHVVAEDSIPASAKTEQLELFRDYDGEAQQQEEESRDLERERKMQEAMLAVKKRFGKNAILKGLNLEEGATARQRNNQIGGHRA
jgi:DNA polymerase V